MEPVEMATLTVGASVGAIVFLKLLERVTDEEVTDYEHQPH